MVNGNYREGLIKERLWRLRDKKRLLARLSHKTSFKAFTQVMKLINEHVKELSKIESILKDRFVEVW